MTSEFLVYLRLGFEHITDPRGYDHILFIVALTAMYVPREWRRVVILVTAFTVGHSVTLALATLELISISGPLVELLIPVTIFLTAAVNGVEVWRSPDGGAEAAASELEPPGARLLKYALALGFGLIHGMGFSNFLRAALGSEASITRPLFAFNVGLEVGQIVIVGLVLLATWAATRVLRAPRRGWILALSSVTGAVALYLVWQRLPFG